jgi:hypothetical protein
MRNLSHFLSLLTFLLEGNATYSLLCIKHIVKERRGQSIHSFRLNSEGNDKQLQRQQDQQSSGSTTFSHTIRAHSILSASNLSTRRASGFIVEINATEEERNALVARFGAKNSFSCIGLLSADLRLRRASTASNSFSASSGSSTTNGAC